MKTQAMQQLLALSILESTQLQPVTINGLLTKPAHSQMATSQQRWKLKLKQKIRAIKQHFSQNNHNKLQTTFKPSPLH